MPILTRKTQRNNGSSACFLHALGTRADRCARSSAEKFIYMPVRGLYSGWVDESDTDSVEQHTLMVTDHKQSFRSDENLSPEERAQTPVEVLWRNEELRRQQMRQEIFPDLSQ